MLPIILLLFLTHLPCDTLFDSYTEEISGTNLKFDMIPIEGGTFMMGSPGDEDGRNDDEGPIHEVAIDGFWISKLEVTWNLYDEFIASANASAHYADNLDALSIDVDGITGASPPYIDMSFAMGKDGFPATSMTQYAAISFCKWLSAKTATFYRLPTEAEWEYACKKGTDSIKLYHIDDLAWHKKNTIDGYYEVGTKGPDANGVHDMLGNIAEWTLDQYHPDFYATSNQDNPLALPTILYPRVLRGGSYKDNPAKCRCSARKPSKAKWKRTDPQLPKSRWWHTNAPFIGIRIVRPRITPSPEEIKKYWLEPIDDY